MSGARPESLLRQQKVYISFIARTHLWPRLILDRSHEAEEVTTVRKTLLTLFAAAVALVMFAAGAALALSAGTGAQGTGTDYRQAFLDRLAAALGIDRSRLDAAAQQAAREVIDQAERNGDITKEQADSMRQRVQESGWPYAWGRGFGHRYGHWGFGHGWKGIGSAGLDAAAAALGMSRTDLVAELRDGKTLAEVAAARGVDARKVRDAVIAAYKKQLDQAVANEDLTRKQADRLLERLQNSDFMNGTLGGCGWKGKGSNNGDSPVTGTSFRAL